MKIFIRDDGSPVLIDFGSARQGLGAVSRALTTPVSPGYAPFEQYFSKGEQHGAVDGSLRPRRQALSRR